ncbi:MAG: sel1 repeat family protein [Rhodobacteraceae bacterium]|nr:sel1 repeat family protein [Paracoccaceae bacterium]
MKSQTYTTKVTLASVFVAALVPFSAYAQSEDSDAQNRCLELAGSPDSGVPVNPDMQEALLAGLAKARQFCEAALDTDNANAAIMFHLGVASQHEGAHDAAIAKFEAAAAAGLAAAETKLGDYHLFGIGPVEADADRALSHYQKASDAGDLAAMTTLAFMYRLGRGVPRDPSEMVRLMGLAAEGGYHFAQYRLAQTYLTGDGIPGGADEALNIPNADEALRLLQMAAVQGNTRAALDLAGLYADNGGGVGEDLTAYARWIQEAAKTGVPSAMAALGFLFEKGRGVEADPDRAAELYVEVMETGQVKFGDLRGQSGARAPYWDRATAIAFQVILKDRGLYLGAIDGIVGPLTTAAAKALDD